MSKHIKSLSELKGYITRLNENFPLGEEADFDLDSSDSMEGSSEKKDDKSSLKSGEVTVDQVIDKINTIRAGKSFRDGEIKMSLRSYFDTLDRAERVALLAFLKGISQVVSGEVPGEKALEPSDPDPQVRMKKNMGSYKVSVTPKINMSQPRRKEQKKKGFEDTSAPAPIKAKK